MNDFISRGDALAVVQYNPNPVEGIKELPAADLVSVVRCKDCEWNRPSNYPEYYPKWLCTCWGTHVHPEHFCSRGERKEA